MKKLSFLFLFVFLQACNVDKSKKVDPSTLDFKTQESTELFFKNIRQSSYFVEENAEAGLILYRNKKWLEYPNFSFTPAIVFNWRQDKAYLLIEEKGDWKEDYTIEVRIKPAAQNINTIYYSSGNAAIQLEFLTAIYNAIIDNSQIFLVTENEEAPFFRDETQRQTFRIILSDYYRLTGAYRK